MSHYYTVLIPFSEQPTCWHPTEQTGPFKVLCRGAFETEPAAHTWAASNLGGQPYSVRMELLPYEPKHLKPWTMPANYIGECWPATYSAGVGQSRDSDALQRSNFACALEALGGTSETVQVVRENHWAVGWVEWIAIHQDDEIALKIADALQERLEEYPILDEDHMGMLEQEDTRCLPM